MGYVRASTYNLLFGEAPGFEGLTVKVRALPVDEFGDVAELMASTGGTQMTRARRLFRELGRNLVAWNVQAEDEAGVLVDVPATVAGLMSLDYDFANTLTGAWTDSLIGTLPLGRETDEFDEADLPMTSLSAVV